MEKVMLSLHVLAAILTVGPVTAAAWLFVRTITARKSAEVPLFGVASLAFLHRVALVGAVSALSVPVFGFATAAQLGVLTDLWLLIAIALTAVAAAVFVWGVLGNQRRLLVGDERGVDVGLVNESGLVGTPGGAGVGMVPGGQLRGPSRATRLLLHSTIAFTVLWMIVVTLMIVRPGSTTGVGS